MALRTRLHLLVVLALLAWLNTPPAAAQTPPGGDVEAGAVLTLQEAVATALRQNDRVLRAGDGMERARLDLSVAEAAFRPQVLPTFNAALGRSALANQTYGLSMWQLFSTGTEVRADARAQSLRNQLGTYVFSDATLLVSQPLLRGAGRTAVRAPVSAAQAGLRAAARDRRTMERQVALEVADAYYGVIGQRALIDAVDKAEERANTLFDQAVARLAAGRVSRLDVLRAEQLQAQAVAERLNARAAFEDALDRLRVLMAVDLATPLRVSPAVPSVPPAPAEADAVGTALVQRPDVATAADAVEDAERRLALAQSQLRPQVDLQFALTQQAVSDDFLSAFGDGDVRFTTLANVALPLNRTQPRAAWRMARLQQDDARVRLHAERLRIAADVRRALRERVRAEQARTLAVSSTDLARSEAEIARLRFERGLSSSLDVVSAEANLLSAEGRVISADGRLALAHLALLDAMGVLDPSVDVR